MPKAIRVARINTYFIINEAKKVGFDLAYLNDQFDYPLPDEDVTMYLITDGSVENNNITFTEMSEAGFRELWKFKYPETVSNFVEIERV